MELTPTGSGGRSIFHGWISAVATRRRDTWAADCTPARRCITYNHWPSMLQRIGASGSEVGISRGGRLSVGYRSSLPSGVRRATELPSGDAEAFLTIRASVSGMVLPVATVWMYKRNGSV